MNDTTEHDDVRLDVGQDVVFTDYFGATRLGMILLAPTQAEATLTVLTAKGREFTVTERDILLRTTRPLAA